MLRRNGKKACKSANDDKDDSAAHSTALSPKTSARRFDVLNQYARLPHQRPKLPAFLDGFARTEAVLQRVRVPRERLTRRTPMHAAALLTFGLMVTCRTCPSMLTPQTGVRPRPPSGTACDHAHCVQRASVHRQPARARQRK